jgi:hypothetical protein
MGTFSISIESEKMRKFTKAGLGCALAMLALTPVAGQTVNAAQTPENAHKFLEAALKGTKFDGAYYSFSNIISSNCATKLEYLVDRNVAKSEINWAAPRAITIDGSLVSLGITRNYALNSEQYFDVSKKIDVGSPEMAVRVQKAMEVIRVSCDKTQGLGF